MAMCDMKEEEEEKYELRQQSEESELPTHHASAVVEERALWDYTQFSK